MAILSLASAPDLVAKLLRSRLVRSTGTLVFYTVAGYLVTVVAGPVLSRVYSPAEFGLYGTFMAYVQACIVLVALNYDTASPAAATDEEAANVALGACALAVLLSVLLSALYVVFIWKNWAGYGALPGSSAWLCALFLLLSAFVSVGQFWCLRQRRFHALGNGAVLTNVGRAVSQVGLAFGSLGWAGLVVGELFGRAATIVQYAIANSKDARALVPKVSPASVLAALYRQRRFAVVLLPPMLGDAVLGAIALPALTALFGIAAAGQYYLMKRLIDLPSALVSRTVSDAFYSHISEHARESPHRIRPLLVRTFALITGTSLFALLPLLLFGPSLFAFVFGEPWREAGLLSAIMVPALVVSLGASPVARVFAVTRWPALRYVFTVVYAVGLLGTLAAAWLAHVTLIQTVVGLSITQFVSYSAYFGSAFIAAGRIQAEGGT